MQSFLDAAHAEQQLCICKDCGINLSLYCFITYALFEKYYKEIPSTCLFCCHLLFMYRNQHLIVNCLVDPACCPARCCMACINYRRFAPNKLTQLPLNLWVCGPRDVFWVFGDSTSCRCCCCCCFLSSDMLKQRQSVKASH